MKTWALGRRLFASVVAGGFIACLGIGHGLAATTPLADQPIRVSDVPANVMLALSVEFPTAITRAHQGATFDTSGNTLYLGYFDPLKCYKYVQDSSVATGNNSNNAGYFRPADFTTKAAAYSCAGKAGQWSGNFMNWATMQGIDAFRWALTGGYRSVDLPAAFADATTAPYGFTVLERAYASQQGSYRSSNFPDRVLSSNLSAYTDTTATGVSSGILGIRNGGLGVQVRFGPVTSSKSSYLWPNATNTGKVAFSTNTEDNTCLNNSTAKCIEFDVRVEVCRDEKVGGVSLLEANCQKYVSGDGSKTVWKPAGLMQQYKDKMYFGAFGYLGLFSANDTDANGVANSNKDGGVLRAKIQPISSEIGETGSFIKDPYGMSAAQGATYSGTINYLNRFGRDAKKYKYYDPVSELYAEVVKYFKALQPTPSYISGLNAQLRDYFPVFTTWTDPALDPKYPTSGALSCKKNYIIGIGDTNSQYDLNNLSGAASPAPGVDSDMAGDTAVSWTNKVGVLEGLGGSLGTTPQGGGTDNGYLIAGIAYYAHSSDIRSDLPDVQNITTYWMDVLEPTIPYMKNNQYWLATKYGGYKKPGNTVGAFDAKDVWFDTPTRFYSDTANNKTQIALPTNYFPASTPADMVSGLQSAFKSIASGSGAGAGAALSSPQLNLASGGGNSYVGTYDASSWKGDVVASSITSFDNSSQPVTTTLWSAATKLNTLAAGSGWDTARKIVTLVPKDESAAITAANLMGATFRFASLGVQQKLNMSKTSVAPTGNDVDGQQVLNYLRGDRTYESTASTTKLYRQRESLLGDIVDSQVVYVGAPGEGYGDAYNPGYSQFVSNKQGRTPVVYVGANDGMLHAFDASSTANAGNELFAVVPYALYAGPDDVPETSGIQALARPTYSHHYYMNATPEVRSVDFSRSGGSISTNASTFNWRTLLVVGEGKGGRSYIGVDVTDVTAGMTESDVASKVLWEFSHPDMGYSFGQPLIVKTAKWGWVVLLTGGYNNISGPNAGQGVLFVVSPQNGELLQAVYTGVGSAASPAGLAQIAGFTPNYQDYTVDYVYGGDLNGNVWRFDLTGSGSIPSPTKIATLVSPDGTAQPVTAIPRVEYSADDLKRYVFVGTGRLLASEDQPNSQVQTIYAIRDGTQSAAYGTADNQMAFPSGGSFPATRSLMSQVSNLVEGAKLTESKPMGWFYDLTGVSGSVRERIIVGLQTFDGVLSWTGSLLNSDPCNVTGTSRTYSVNYGTGQSVLYTTSSSINTPVQYLEGGSTGLTGIRLVRLGNKIVIVGTTADGKMVVFEQAVAESGDPRVVNWRIIRE